MIEELLLPLLLLPLLGGGSPTTGPTSGPARPQAKAIVTFGAAQAPCSTQAPNCLCSTNAEGKLSALCSRKLEKFPRGLPANLSVLSLHCDTMKDGQMRPIVDFRFMTALPEDAFRDTPLLEQVVLSGCPVAELPPLLFANLTRLTSLSLEALLLRRLGGSLLHGSYNLASLQVLDMADLTAADAVLLSAQTRLETVVLKRTSLPGATVAALLSPLRRTLRRLTWALSQVSVSPPANAFAGFRLRLLDLHANRLGDARFLLQTRTRALVLRGNRALLATAPPTVDWARCRGLRSLLELDLRETGLRELTPGSLAHMRRLRRLYLGENQLTAVPPDLARYLATVLTRLDLSNNRIQAFPEALEALFLRRGVEVLLERNPLHCNCEAAWLLKFAVFTRGLRCASAPAGSAALRGKSLAAVAVKELVCLPPSMPRIQATNAMQMRPARWEARVAARMATDGEDGRLIQYVEGRKTVRVSRGQTLSLRCSSKGDPAPDLFWEFPWGATLKRVAPTDRTIFSNEMEAKIRQEHLGYLYEANFTCRAVNRAASTQDFITLINMHPATTPKKAVEVVPSKPSRVTPQPSKGGVSDGRGNVAPTSHAVSRLLTLLAPLLTALAISGCS